MLFSHFFSKIFKILSSISSFKFALISIIINFFSQKKLSDKIFSFSIFKSMFSESFM